MLQGGKTSSRDAATAQREEDPVDSYGQSYVSGFTQWFGAVQNKEPAVDVPPHPL